MPQKRGALTGHRLALVASVFAIILVAVYFGWRATGFDDGSGGAAVAARAANPPAGTDNTFMAEAKASGPTPELVVPDRGAAVGSPSVADAAGQTSVVRSNAAAGGQTVTLQVGQQLAVTLGPGWSRPRAQTPPSDAGSAVQPLRTDPAGPPDPSAAATVFTAVRVGQAVVVAQGSAGATYEVPVVVQPAPHQGAGPLVKRPSP